MVRELHHAIQLVAYFCTHSSTRRLATENTALAESAGLQWHSDALSLTDGLDPSVCQMLDCHASLAARVVGLNALPMSKPESAQ